MNQIMISSPKGQYRKKLLVVKPSFSIMGRVGIGSATAVLALEKIIVIVGKGIKVAVTDC